MAKYMLDTDTCIELFKHNNKVLEKIMEVGQENCFVSEITIAELFYGAAKSGQQKHFNDISFILQSFELIPLFPSLRIYGTNKAELEKIYSEIDELEKTEIETIAYARYAEKFYPWLLVGALLILLELVLANTRFVRIP